MQQRRVSPRLAVIAAALAVAVCSSCSALTAGGSNETLPPLVPGNSGPPAIQIPPVGPDGQPVLNTQGSTTTVVDTGAPVVGDADDSNPLSVAARFLAAVAADDQATGTDLEIDGRSPAVFDWATTAYQQYTELTGAGSWGAPTCAEPDEATVRCSWLQTDAAPTLVLVQDGSAWRVSHPAFSIGDGQPGSAGTGCIVGSSSVNFRGGPGTSWPRFTQIDPGTCSISVFDRLESDPIEGDQWRLIESDGQRGWVVDRVIEIQ